MSYRESARQLVETTELDSKMFNSTKETSYTIFERDEAHHENEENASLKNKSRPVTLSVWPCYARRASRELPQLHAQGPLQFLTDYPRCSEKPQVQTEDPQVL